MYRVNLSQMTVTRIELPRVEIVFTREPDGSYQSIETRWIDNPPLNAALIATIAREAGGALRNKIREESN